MNTAAHLWLLIKEPDVFKASCSAFIPTKPWNCHPLLSVQRVIMTFLLFSNACYSHYFHLLGKCINPPTLVHLLLGENKAVCHIWEGHIVVMHDTLCALPCSQIVSISNHLPCRRVEHLGFTFSMPRHSYHSKHSCCKTEISIPYEKITVEWTASLLFFFRKRNACLALEEKDTMRGEARKEKKITVGVWRSRERKTEGGWI